jgi:hypothetical protein
MATFWLILKFIIGSAIVPYVWTFFSLPFVGLMSLAMARGRMFWAYLVAPFQALYQAYFWGLWGAWCAVLVLRYVAVKRGLGFYDVPSSLGFRDLWIVLLAWGFAILPAIRLALKDSSLSDTARERSNAWKALILVGGYSTVAYCAEFVAPRSMKSIYGWALNILHRFFD